MSLIWEHHQGGSIALSHIFTTSFFIMRQINIWLLYSLSFLGCSAQTTKEVPIHVSSTKALTYQDSLVLLFKNNSTYYSMGFDYPVGKPNAKGYYNAQPFGKNNHLGDDWNGTGGGNTDLGDPVFAVANGYVTQSVNFYGGWGRVLRIAHAIPKGDSLVIVESLYAHMDTMTMRKGQWVMKGDNVGTIGNAGGIYLAHLHLEIRDGAGYELGGGYSTNTKGYLDPTKFIKENRK